jgi:hypothetical protein
MPYETAEKDEFCDTKHLTKRTLIQHSPYTDLMQRALQDVDGLLFASDEAPENCFYSPSGFSAIKSWMHLLPLWSKCVPTDALKSGDRIPATNGQVESYFKDLKKGTACGRKKMRPRELLVSEMRRVQGSLNELMLPRTGKNERKVTTLNDEEEKWRRRKPTRKTGKYSSKEMRKVFLTPRISKNECKSQRPKTDEKTLGKRQTIITETETDLLHTKKRRLFEISLGAVELNDLSVDDAFAVDPRLTSDDMDAAFNVLRKKLSDSLFGLQSTVLGQCAVGWSVPKFRAIEKDKKFVQILHLPNHWICVTNAFSEELHSIDVYDSAHNNLIGDQATLQLTSLLRLHDSPDEMSINLRNCARQSFASQSCGYYALACVVAVLNGQDPTLWRYNENDLVRKVKMAIQGGDFSIIESARSHTVCEPLNIKTYTVHKLHCVCHGRSRGDMVQCSSCSTWFHCPCVNVQPRKMRNISWSGPCCR